MSEDRVACRRRAMDLLARREHSRAELERKLATREFGPDLIGPVLDELEADGLLSDERFARSFVAARYERGQGPRRIRQELSDRGIEAASDWLAEDRFDWSELARSVRHKRFGPEPPRTLQDKARQVRFLEYRGFSHEQIRRALEFDDE